MPSAISSPVVTPSPSQSTTAVIGNVILRELKEHGSNGSVPSETSWPLVTPSSSQSRDNHKLSCATVTLSKMKEHGSVGSVPSSISSAVFTPSPSQSVTAVTACGYATYHKRAWVERICSIYQFCGIDYPITVTIRIVPSRIGGQSGTCKIKGAAI